MATKRVGYFDCVESGGRFIGALMVTDTGGIPQEFKYTEPIKPTRIQSILYGGSLERYLKIDVIRAKLFKAVTSRPEYIFVNNADSSLIGTVDNVPVLMLHRAPIQGLNDVSATRRPRENELMVKDHENRDPLRIVCHPETPAVLDGVQELVLEVGYEFDIAEPLTRVDTAINALLSEAAK
jgi:hypothetical protein